MQHRGLGRYATLLPNSWAVGQSGRTPPRLVIREVMAGTLLAAPEAVSCPESTPEIRIHFQGISFRTGAGQMRYSHRLLGHGPAEQWSAFTAADTVAYNALPVGEYLDDLWRAGRGAFVGHEPREAALSHEEVRVAPTEEVVGDQHGKSWKIHEIP